MLDFEVVPWGKNYLFLLTMISEVPSWVPVLSRCPYLFCEWMNEWKNEQTLDSGGSVLKGDMSLQSTLDFNSFNFEKRILDPYF